MKIALKFCFFICLALAFSGCKKPDVNDYKGDTGTAGSDAQVSSFIVGVKDADWAADTIKKRWVAKSFSNEVTDKVINEGTLSVFIELEGTWYALPYAYGDSYINFAFAKQFIYIFKGDSHGDIPDKSPGTVKIKYVLINN